MCHNQAKILSNFLFKNLINTKLINICNATLNTIGNNIQITK